MNSRFYYTVFVLILSTLSIYSQWSQQSLQGDINVNIGIDFIDPNHGLTGGWYGDLSQQIYGKAFYTNDGGLNWIAATSPDSFRVMVSVQMINDLVAYGAGAYNKSGVQTHTNSNYNQTLSLRARKNYERIGIDFSGQENYRGYFVETTDGGLTWHPKGSFEDSVYYLVGMTFIDQQTGFVIGSSQGVSGHCILKTSDGGNNWYYVYPFQQGIWIEDIEFFDNLNGIAVGEETVPVSAGVILKTTDGGENWIKSYPGNMSSIFSVVYLDLNTLLVAGLNTNLVSGIFKSTNGGSSWQQFHTYSGSHFIDGVDAFQNSGIILVYGGFFPSSIYIPIVDISIDNGFTWNYSVFNQFEDYILVNSKMISETNWYLCGGWVTSNGFILFTDNSGGVPVELISFTAEALNGKINLIWTTATELNNRGFEVERKSDNEDWRMIGFIEGKGTTIETQNYNFVDDLFGVADSKIYYRLKQIDFNGTYEYSEEIEVERAPASFNLEQNYPNPFNPTTKIKFTIPQSPLLGGDGRGGLVTLKVYDILGTEVATLVNEELPAGEYEVEFDTSSGIRNLVSGVYFYQLIVGGPETSSGQRIIQTKKMVYLK